MVNSVKSIGIIFLCMCYAVSMAQNARLVQVKLFNKSMQPMSIMEFSFDEAKRYKTNDKGVAVVKMTDDQLPPKDVYVYDNGLEAESWNYSKGVLEIIIRKRTTKTVKGVVKNLLNEPIPNLSMAVGQVNKRITSTNAYGEFIFKVPLDFKIENRSAYSFDGYNFKRLELSQNLLLLFVEKVKVVDNTPVASAEKEVPAMVEPVKNDTASDISSFYNYLKGISLEDLNEEQQSELNDIFYQLVNYYEDSLKGKIYTKFSGISENSKIKDDLGYLIKRAEMEQNIASEFNRLFAEKIGLINKKLAAGGKDLSPAEREAVLKDIEHLDKVLRKNESLFKENQADYRKMFKSISTNLLQINDLEEKLDVSEQQRKEQQQVYEQRVLFYSIGIGLLIVFLVVLAYFFGRIKKQKDKTQKAYKKINDLNEHLEELVEERTAMLEMTNAELDTFFYKSAHNLRRPILSILGLSEIAKLTLDKEGQDLFEKATETATSMDTMLKKLIMVSHINYPSDKDVVDFKAIVDKIEGEFKPKSILFTKTITAESFVSYPMLMDIVLRNLLENSFEFSMFSEQKPHVGLEISENENGLTMVVSDNGQGIEGSEEEKVWRMFYVANENASGNGLGLYIAQKAVKTLNGTIKYNRTKDNVTQFIVIIPKSHA